MSELVSVYNTVPTHARPLSLNVMTNTLVGYIEYNSPEDNHGITVTNHPLPLSETVYGFFFTIHALRMPLQNVFWGSKTVDSSCD